MPDRFSPLDRRPPRGYKPLPNNGSAQPQCLACKANDVTSFCRAQRTVGGTTYYYCPHGCLPGIPVRREPCHDEPNEPTR